MPRTKVVRKKAKNDEIAIDKKALLDLYLTHKKALEEEIAQVKKDLNAHNEKFYIELFSNIRKNILEMPLGELKKNTSAELNSTKNTTSKELLLTHTKNGKKNKTAISRSSSLDEGYLTTESSNSVSRASSATRGRSKAKKAAQEKRTTRSLSKSNVTGFTTPSEKRTPDHFGVVTPKCKPNMPHILLRRPKPGETALSFQGSPLLVNPVAEDTVANINIPLNDGTLLSLQPQKGLRLSQIPDFNAETLKQLETLQHHINMVLNKKY